MTLLEANFSNLIIVNNEGYFKGSGNDIVLSPAPSECADEIRDLVTFLRSDEAKRIHKFNLTDSSKTEFSNSRIAFKGVSYRVTFSNTESGEAWFLRKLETKIKDFNTIGFPEPYRDYLLDSRVRQGLILFVGSQASGKTTSANSLIAQRLLLHGGLALTYENPPELPLNGTWGKGLCLQQSLEKDEDLAEKLTLAYRQTPNIIFVGEIKSDGTAAETLRTALGSDNQLVIATIHGQSIKAALLRLTQWAKKYESNADMNLSTALSAVIVQELDFKQEPNPLKVREALFCPVGSKNKRVMGIRSRLLEGKFDQLDSDISIMFNLCNQASELQKELW